MKENTKKVVLLAARSVVSRKGFDCSLREIATAAEVSYGHVHRSWESKEALLEDAEKLLHQELKDCLGESSASETVSILLVRIWYGLQTVTFARSFLIQTLKPEYPKFSVENTIASRLREACDKHHLVQGKNIESNVLSSSLYLFALMSDPSILKGLCSLFEVDQLPEELNIFYLNKTNKFLLKD